MTLQTMKVHLCIILVIMLSILMFDPVEMSGKINFETVKNYMGETVIFYDQEINGNSTNTTSYEVTSMMTCRRIKNATQSSEKPLNLVSVGTLENGTIVCKVAYQDIGLLKLSPKIGMITFLDKPKDDFFLAKSGIFYQAPPRADYYGYLNEAYKHCPDNWELANAITPTLKNELTTFMTEKGIDEVVVNATCSTTKPHGSWNDGTPFSYELKNTIIGTWIKYSNQGPGSEIFSCATVWSPYFQVVCIVKIYCDPWTEF